RGLRALRTAWKGGRLRRATTPESVDTHEREGLRPEESGGRVKGTTTSIAGTVTGVLDHKGTSSMKVIIATLGLLTGLASIPAAYGQGGRSDSPALKESPSAGPRPGGLAAWADPLLDRCRDVEFVQMLTAILGGSHMGPGEGWFHPGQGRYGWDWLRKRFD